MSNVLWLSNETPDLHGQGGQRRQYFQIAALAAAGCQITVMTFAGPQSDTSIRRLCEVIRVRPRLRGRLANPAASLQRRALVGRRWQAIVVAHTESWPYWKRYVEDLPGTPCLVDLHNVMGLVDEELAVVERELAGKVDRVSVCSNAERSRLMRVLGHGGEVPALVVPHGVSPDEWLVDPRPSLGPSVKLFGSWAWAPNNRGLAWFLREVWEPLHTQHPEITCTIAGTGIEGMTLPSGASSAGRVAHLAQFLADAWVLAVPVWDGRGAPVKFLEAVATGVPVVATADGAPLAGALAGLVSDDADAWVDWISSLIADPEPAHAMSQASRRVALTRYSWDAVSWPLVEWVTDLPR